MNNSKSHNSTLRRYDADDFTVYEDFVPDEYLLHSIQPLKGQGSYFLYGMRRSNRQAFFLYFDGRYMQEVAIESVCREAPQETVFDAERGNILAHNPLGFWRFSPEGKLLETIPHPEPHDRTMNISDIFRNMDREFPGSFECARQVSSEHGLEGIPNRDYLKECVYSSCGRYVFYAANRGFYVTDAKTGAVLASAQENYGVQSVVQLAPDLVAMSAFGKGRVYQLVEDT